MNEIEPDSTLVPGTDEWWDRKDLWGPLGVVDSCLRLFEHGAITRSKLRELLNVGLEYVADFSEGTAPPDAPWNELNWCDND